MANVRPFKAYRPMKGKESQVAALPYDVYTREEAKKVVANNPLSFLNIDRAETQFPDNIDTYAPCVYQKARELLYNEIKKGIFVEDDIEHYYLYELIMNGRSQTGIVGCASIDDYLNQVIMKHENTRADKELDRINHVDILDMQTGPIFLAYRDNETLHQIICREKAKEPICRFTSENEITHVVYRIDDSSIIEQIKETFESMKHIYIADGHHRCASAVKVGLKRREQNVHYQGNEEFNYFLSVLFPDNELMIMDYNRVVKDLNGLSDEMFLNKIREIALVEDMGETAYKPLEKGVFSMYLNNHWYKVILPMCEETNDPVKCLDVSRLQDLILSKILGISDPKTDKRIDFIGGIRGLEELERRVHLDMKVAFAMYPTSIQELFDVADHHCLMPPKSTWFEPKLRSGLFLHKI